MDFDFTEIMAGPATDPEARARFLADPRGYLESMGATIPPFVTVVAAETDTPTMTMGIPPMLEDGELSELALDGVSGGANQSACSMV